MPQQTLERFFNHSDAEEVIEASDQQEEKIWSPRVALRSGTDQTTSSMSAAEGSGKVNLTYVCPLQVGSKKESQLLNYISEVQSIRRNAAHMIQSFQDEDKKPQNGLYGVLKDKPYFKKSALLANNKLCNVGKVGEAFASWVSNGHDKEKPFFGSKDYICVSGDNVTFDNGGVNIRFGGSTSSEVVDSQREADFNFPLRIGQYQSKVVEAINDKNVKVGRSEIHHRDDDWFLHLTISYTQPVYDWKDVDKWIGIDLGTVNLYSAAVVELSDQSPHDNDIDVLGAFSGPGKALMHERRQQKNSLRYLQQNYGYEVASEKLGQKLARQSIQLEHEYANEIVREAELNAPCGIVFENLKGIKGLGWSNLWAYFRFKQVITYKAHQRGVPVLTLGKGETRNTSQDCSSCGERPENGRISRSQFECSECGYGPVDADTNAAINIARRLLNR